MKKIIVSEFRLLPVAAAILMIYGNAYAEDTSEVHDLITPDSSVSIGVGAINHAQDAKRFSQYTGLNQYGSPLIDFDVNKRDDATGLWTKFSGHNLGLDTREIKVSQSKQGDWKYALDYNEIVRRDPYTIHTGMTGVGTTTPTVNLIAFPTLPAGNTPSVAGTVVAGVNPNGYKLPVAPAAANDIELKLKRTALGLSGEKWITPELQFELSFRNEDKKGARMFGRAGLGSNDMKYTPATSGLGSYAILLTPEPIDSSTRLLEARLNFARDNLAVTAGYFGSFFVNNVGSMSPTVPNILNRGILSPATGAGATLSSSVQQLAQSAVALPPDNQAHQLYVSGNYAFSDTTRSTFKLAYTHATQNESFAAMGLGLGPNGQTSLGGVVDTTLAQFGLTMRPMKELSVNASLRYEDRADKTPLSVYNYGTTAISNTGAALNGTTNWNSGSQTRTSAKLDGVYRLPEGYSIAAGGDWERKTAPLPPSNVAIVQNQVFLRNTLNEYGIHAEVRKAMSETLNGALGFEYKERRGSEWWTTTGTAGNALTTLTAAGLLVSSTNTVLPDLYMDRNRSKLRANLDWEATEKVSLQALVEHTQDDYKRQPAILPVQVIPTIPGARTIIADSVSLDGSYSASENWKFNAFATRSYNRWNVNKASLSDDTRNTDDTIGVGIRGKATSHVSVGMDLLTTRDITTFNNQTATAVVGQLPGNIVGFSAALPGNYLPAIHYKTNKLNLHAKYDVDKMSSVLALFSYQEFKTDDWQWGYNGTPFLYSDNTTVSQSMNQKLKYLSVSYMLKF
jgi:MtrB/PioB family decaheme-associated outer membrane protein